MHKFSRITIFLKHQLRFLAAAALLPVLESGEEAPLVGGQAVLEGVMMRSPHAWGIAVRKESGEMVTHSEVMESPKDKRKWLGWPFVRGLVTLGSALSLGYRALQFSTNVMLEEEQKDIAPEKRIQFQGWLMWVNVIFSIAFLIVMYKFLPLLITTKLESRYAGLGNHVIFAGVEGLIRVSIFLTFMWLLSQAKDIYRLFQFHGGEHKTVFNFESGEEVNVANAQKWPTFHPRCGTSFLMTLMLLFIPIYMVLPKYDFWTNFGIRIVMLVFMSSISYEVIRLAARNRSGVFAIMTQPGLWLQRITTKPPDDTQVACAIRALDEAFALEKQRGGELTIA